MAQFGDTLSEVQAIGGGGGSPVVDTTPLAVAQAFGSVANIFIAEKKEEQKRKTELRLATTLSSFQDKQLRIADAVERGEISPTEGRVRMRNNISVAITSNPLLSSEFLKLQKELTTTSGAAKSAADAAESVDKTMDSARQNGFVLPGMTQEESEEGRLNYLRLEQSAKIAQAEQARLTLERSKLGLSKDKVEFNLLQQKKSAQDNISIMADSYMPKLQTGFSKVLADLESGSIDSSTAQRLISEQFLPVSSTIASVGSRAGQEYINIITSPMKELRDLSLSLAKGELARDSYQTQVDQLIAKQKLLFLQNEEDRETIIASQLFSRIPLEIYPTLNSRAINFFKKNMTPGGGAANILDGEEKESVNKYLETIRKAIEKDPERLSDLEKEEQDNHVTNIIRAIPKYSASTDRVEDYVPAVKFLSSSAFGSWRQRGGKLDTGQVSQAKQALQSQYIDVVLPAIQEAYSRASAQLRVPLNRSEEFKHIEGKRRTSERTGTTTIEVPTFTLFEPVFSGTGVTFQVSPDAPEVPFEISKAPLSELNKKVAPRINELIRMGAHIDSHVDYKKIYEENYKNLFAPSPEKE